jgi:hypothetical protein
VPDTSADCISNPVTNHSSNPDADYCADTGANHDADSGTHHGAYHGAHESAYGNAHRSADCISDRVTDAGAHADGMPAGLLPQPRRRGRLPHLRGGPL